MARLKKAVYTVVTGGGYHLREPEYKNETWDYICFTNTNIESKGWKVIKIQGDCPNNILSRKVKMLNDFYLPEYDLSIYIDSKFTVKMELDTFVDRYKGENHVFFMKHNKRRCLYAEGEFCIEKGIGNSSKIRKQLAKYQKSGCPKNNGLFAGGIIIRDHNISSQKDFMEEWFKEIENERN